MKLVMPDTNIYGWAIARRRFNDKRQKAINSSLLIENLVKEKDKERATMQVYSCEQVENELKREKIRKELTDIKLLHDSLITGIVKNTRKAVNLTNEYLKECRKRKLSNISFEDLIIYACATRSRCDYLVTENRKNLNRQDVVQVLRIINKRKNLKIPEILDGGSALKKLFSL